jgi:DNA-binding transcriptional regulator GbsR (MarR family)
VSIFSDQVFSVKPLATENKTVHSKAMKRFTVNEAQLKLISDVKLYSILARFDEPYTPSEVAKRLNIPANTVHYHVKKLVAAKLLNCVTKHGRQCKYQRVSDKFRFHESLLPRYEYENSGSTAQHLKKIQKHFLSQAEKTQEDDFKRDKNDHAYLLLDFKDFEEMDGFHETLALTLEVSLSKTQHTKFVKALEVLFAEIKGGVSKGEMYTFCLLTCPGRATHS